MLFSLSLILLLRALIFLFSRNFSVCRPQLWVSLYSLLVADIQTWSLLSSYFHHKPLVLVCRDQQHMRMYLQSYRPSSVQPLTLIRLHRKALLECLALPLIAVQHLLHQIRGIRAQACRDCPALVGLLQLLGMIADCTHLHF